MKKPLLRIDYDTTKEEWAWSINFENINKHVKSFKELENALDSVAFLVEQHYATPPDMEMNDG